MKANKDKYCNCTMFHISCAMSLVSVVLIIIPIQITGLVSLTSTKCNIRTTDSVILKRFGRLNKHSNNINYSINNPQVPVVVSSSIFTLSSSSSSSLSSSINQDGSSLHGENACFLPLKQLDQDTYSPRIVQIAGTYPGITKEEYLSVQSEESPPQGQWTYDFSDSNGSQVGTVALEGTLVVHSCVDPVVIIAEHFALNVPLPSIIVDPVDLVVLVDRAKNYFSERKFLVIQLPTSKSLQIGAYNAKSDIPPGSEILGQIVMVNIPWLPSMAPTRTGFMETDEYY